MVQRNFSIFAYEPNKVKTMKKMMTICLLAANALGLGAVWTGLYPNEERAKDVRNIVKAPEHIVPLCTIVIGHPAENPTPKDKWKPENVSYNEFGK